ncbi:hypothetical protein MRX96_023920 [Rhipicephalus microplus]
MSPKHPPVEVRDHAEEANLQATTTNVDSKTVWHYPAARCADEVRVFIYVPLTKARATIAFDESRVSGTMRRHLRRCKGRRATAEDSTDVYAKALPYFEERTKRLVALEFSGTNQCANTRAVADVMNFINTTEDLWLADIASTAELSYLLVRLDNNEADYFATLNYLVALLQCSTPNFVNAYLTNAVTPTHAVDHFASPFHDELRYEHVWWFQRLLRPSDVWYHTMSLVRDHYERRDKSYRIVLHAPAVCSCE